MSLVVKKVRVLKWALGIGILLLNMSTVQERLEAAMKAAKPSKKPFRK